MRDLHSLALKREKGKIWVLDQQRLPREEIWHEADSPESMAAMIRRLAIRGAPLIGVGAALSLGRLAAAGPARPEWERAADRLRAARPTAVNLMAAVDRMRAAEDPVAMAETIFDEDVALCEAMARHGAPLIQDGDGILTHCNTGGLATAGVGTALGVIRRAHESGKRIHVFVDETRPLLQGARLTAWELQKLGIPYTLLCDNAAASLMSTGKIQRAFVGADRIARNGDFANKIGTYGVAILARHHGIGFYTVAPRTTLDWQCPDGAHIPVEQREGDEVRGAAGSFGEVTWSPPSCPTYNPAFDVTPAALLTAIVLDTGVVRPADLLAQR